MTINNIGALQAQRQLYSLDNIQSSSIKKLSSGKRINNAKDDAAALAISNSMTVQIRGMSQAVRNASDGMALGETAEGALKSSTDVVGRMRELSLQASNDTLSHEDRNILNEEFNQLKEELTSIAESTQFNAQNLLDGSFQGNFQVDAGGGENVQITISDMSVTGLSLDLISLDNLNGAQDAVEVLDNALEKISDTRGKLGSYKNRFESVISNTHNSIVNTVSAKSRILDEDMAKGAMESTREQILQQAGIAVLAQSNQSNQMTLSLLR